jgi:hypothetical protein
MLPSASRNRKVLLVRGTARLEPVSGIVPEYALAAERYFGEQQGKAWVAQLASMIQDMVRTISLQAPENNAMPLFAATCAAVRVPIDLLTIAA